MELVSVGEIGDIYLPKDVADVLNGEADGILCACLMMGYELDFRDDLIKGKDKKVRVAVVGAYKEQDYYFEIRMYCDQNNVVHRIAFNFNEDILVDVKQKALGKGLTVNVLNCIEIDTDEEMTRLFSLIRELLI
jgi:hypothetical protein